MESIQLNATEYLPFIDFNPGGKLLMEGRSIPEDVNKLFDPLIEFANELEAGEVVFDINLEYFNLIK